MNDVQKEAEIKVLRSLLDDFASELDKLRDRSEARELSLWRLARIYDQLLDLWASKVLARLGK